MILLLLEAAVRALALAIVTGVLLWLLRVKNVSAKRTAWTIVLLAAFAMPALMQSPWVPTAFQWKPSIPERQPQILYPTTPTAILEPFKTVRPATTIETRSSSLPIASTPSPAIATKPAWHPTPALFLAIYGAIAAVLTLRLFLGLFSAMRLWRRASPHQGLATSRVSIRVSHQVCSPVTIGSAIVLPSDYRKWPPEKLRAVLAHECAHVRNFDFHFQLLAAFYAAIFWFSPLGWWLRHHLAVLAESISDHAGIIESDTRSDYAEIVLQFAAMPRRPMTGVAMACTGNISRRIEQLLNQDLYSAAFAHGRKRARVAFVLIAVTVFATSLLLRVPSAHAAQEATAPPPPPAAAQLPVLAPPAPVAAVSAPPAPRQIARAQESTTTTQSTTVQSNGDHSNSYSYGFSDGGDSYALIDGSNSNVTFSGRWNSGESQEAIEKARRAANGSPFLWFRHDGKSYIVTDPSIVANLKALYAPMEELGRQQEELGKKQEELGRQQEALGQKQEQAAIPTPDMSREIADLNAAIAKLQDMKGKEMTSEQLADLQGKLGDLQGKLGDIQGQIGEKQGALGAEQGRLGEQQGKLGEQQGRIGEQQGKIAQAADKKVKAVIQQSLSNGQAKPIE
ncbi:MAG TPA: M56 family metallopeptidase [Candidatus Koribacter sp.]|jgi:beta-lactamase regulating signal transducer with metallopeptidase domain